MSSSDTRAPADTIVGPLIALVLGQVCLHSCMAGVRVAAPLQALRNDMPQWAVGLLLGLFAAAPVLLALPAGRLADRHGYHRPMGLAVVLTALGGLIAVGSTWLGTGQFVMLCVAATLCGVGANVGLIAIQRSAGRLGQGSNLQMARIFGWLGLAPAISNVVGPVIAGVMIDATDFRGAFLALAALPVLSLFWMRRVPIETITAQARGARRQPVGELLKTPGLKRLLLVNWLMTSSWDMHAFVVPILGHERGFSASAIGFILGGFAAAVGVARVLVPLLMRRIHESRLLSGAMVMAAVILVVYPWAHLPWLMGVCAVALGMALGSVQPVIMTTLHHITPPDRHGQAIALRSMTINGTSAVMPLVYGTLGAAVGASPLFWIMGAALWAGSYQARRVGQS